MRPRRSVSLSRRALGTRLAGAAAALGFGHRAGAAQAGEASAVMEPDLRDAALRGLALAEHRGDPVSAAAARVTLERLAQSDPEAALLVQIYKLLDVRPARYWHGQDAEAAGEDDLARLHGAICACRPVAFRYSDMSGGETTRLVRPLVLVHPAQGVKLLAWCELRGDYRQFFVRSISALETRSGDFSDARLDLLEGLLEKESGRV